MDWAEASVSESLNDSVRSSLTNKRINYDLVSGKIHMDDIMLVLDPSGNDKAFVPDTIQHYPVMNGKLEVLRGEEIERRFDYRVVCTNQNAVSDIERRKADELHAVLEQIVRAGVKDEEELRSKLNSVDSEFRYGWQDQREVRANALLNHYCRQQNINGLFAEGFMDALTVGEEIYWCHVRGGSPVVDRMDPLKIHCWRSGMSSKIEDADVVVYEDYWSIGKVYETFHAELTKSDRQYLERLGLGDRGSGDGYRDETKAFVNANLVTGDAVVVDGRYLFGGKAGGDYTDSDGNVRVLHMWWKSLRPLKRVKRYDPETGEAEYLLLGEDYIADKTAGEEVEDIWVNEAWEGFKIGKDIYIGIRPCEVQFNTMENPSVCHFGLVGSFYNINSNRVFSMVDTLKPFAYLYDVIHERLNEAMASHIGQAYELDMASVPEGWTPEKFMFYLRKNHIAVKDSFKEGNYGAATGKLAGNFAANSRGIIGNDNGNIIQQHQQILAFIVDEMSKASGITPQREGMVQNRETVGGIERATLQSSYITEWLFSTHNDVKRRVLEAYLEVLKFSMKGRNESFQYKLSDGSLSVMEIDGDEFVENDYGLIVDNSPYAQRLSQELGTLAQAAMQNQTVSMSSVMRIYTSTSVSETIRLIQAEEEERMRQQQEQLQQQQRLAQQQLEQNMQLEQARMEAEERRNIRDNETKLEIARIQAQGRIEAEREYGEAIIDEETEIAKLNEQARQFDAKLQSDERQAADDRAQEERKRKDENALKRRELEIKAKEVEVKRAQAHSKNTSGK